MTIPDYEAEGSKPFQYATRAKTVLVNSYWELPARLFDDSAELAQWARAALAAAQRAKVKKRPKVKEMPKKAVKKPANKPAKKVAKPAKAAKKVGKKSPGRKRATRRA